MKTEAEIREALAQRDENVKEFKKELLERIENEDWPEAFEVFIKLLGVKGQTQLIEAILETKGAQTRQGTLNGGGGK